MSAWVIVAFKTKFILVLVLVTFPLTSQTDLKRLKISSYIYHHIFIVKLLLLFFIIYCLFFFNFCI